jgi:oligopeptide transport system substrate-binding protein
MFSQPLSRRAILRASAGATALSLLAPRGIGAQDVPADAAETQEYRLPGITRDVRLDPHLSYSVYQIGTFTYRMWAGLTKMDANLQVVPDIATRWEISPDGTTYTFHLDPNRKFSDGSPITAEDVVWSWTRSLDPATESLVAGSYLRDVVGATDYWEGVATAPPTSYRALDEVTLEVRLNQPRNYFPEVLIHPSTFVVKRSDVEKGTPEAPWFTQATAFSGPYAIESYEEGQSLVLTANPNYPVKHTIGRISYRLVDDPQTQFLLYQNDEVDFTPLAVPEADNIKNQDPTYRAELVEEPQWWHGNLYLRNGLAPFDDEQVRRAFMMAIDKEALLASVLKGLNRNITGLFYPGLDTYQELPGIPFDVEGAKAELAASGYGGAEALPAIGFWTTDEAQAGTEGRIVAALQEMWRQHLGVEVETRVVPTYDEMLQSDVQIAIGEEAFHFPDSTNGIGYLRCRSGSNIAQFCDEAWEAKTEEAASTPDPARSIQLYREAEREVIDRAVVYPMYQVVSYSLVKPHVKNLKTTAMYTFPDFERVYIADE